MSQNTHPIRHASTSQQQQQQQFSKQFDRPAKMPRLLQQSNQQVFIVYQITD
jgi:hypothetical protein